ncbi:MAG: pilus assembly protein PilM [Planctomycetes bacterium]|nr:pilus assembly protein PilM [Planctomycetota bacterium]
MVRTVGIDPGDALVKVVELDGSYRKPRLLQVHAEPVVAGLPKSVVVATAVQNALAAGMKGEVRLGHPCREAVLRTLDLPFKGKDALRKVVKAEAESEIHGFAVDDMVVDFLEVGGGTAGGSRVLVAAVPKDGLRTQLAALEAVAVEPETVDLDTMALWRAADWAGAFERDAAAGIPEDGVTAIVDVGSRSVRVLLVAGDQLVDMRTLRLGELAVADDIAARHGLSLAAARQAVDECTASGESCVVDVALELPAAAGTVDDDHDGGGDFILEEEGEGETGGGAATRAVIVRPEEVDAARAAFLQRLRRELVRYLTASGRGDLCAVWMTGAGCRMPGIDAVLTEAFDLEPRELDLLAHLQHDLDEDAVARLGPRLAVAIGLALAPMGGPQGFDLRREDLAYTRGFERIKFPLTITLMVALLALFVYGNHRAAELNLLELEIGKTHVGEGNKVDFFGQVNMALAGRWWENPQNFRLESRGKGNKDYKFKDLRDELVETPVHRRVSLLRDKLKLVAAQKQKESGIYESVALESGYAVLVRFSEVLSRVEPEIGPYLLTKLDLNMKGKRRTLEFTIAFRGSDFRQKGDILMRAFEAEYARPDSPFEPPELTKNKEFSVEKPFRDYDKTKVDGIYNLITLNVKESFTPFGAGGQR